MKHFDLLGNKVKFRLDGNSKIKTSIGSILTIIILLIALLSFSLLGDDLIKRRKPTIMQYETLEDDLRRTNPIKFAISIRDKTGEATITPFIKINDNKINTNALIPCQQTDLFKSLSYDIYSYIHHDIKSYYCMPEEIYKTSDIILEIK